MYHYHYHHHHHIRLNPPKPTSRCWSRIFLRARMPFRCPTNGTKDWRANLMHANLNFHTGHLLHHLKQEFLTLHLLRPTWRHNSKVLWQEMRVTEFFKLCYFNLKSKKLDSTYSYHESRPSCFTFSLPEDYTITIMNATMHPMDPPLEYSKYYSTTQLSVLGHLHKDYLAIYHVQF